MGLAALASSGCRGCARSIDPAVVGATAAQDGVDFAPYLAASHAIVTHGPPVAGEPPPRPGSRVFVTAWRPGKPPARATGLGPTLFASVVAASQRVADSVEVAGDAGAPPPPVRVEIDVLTSAESTSLESKMRERIFDVGLNGYLASDGPAHVGWVLPSEILDDHEFDPTEKKQSVALRGDRLMSILTDRAGVELAEIGRMTAVRFRVAEWVEPASPAEPPLPLFRRMPPRPQSMTPDALLAAVRAGADYLAGVTDDHGMFMYLYDPVTDVRGRGYGLLRHAGSLYALMEAYEEFHVPRWADRARLLIGYLKSKVQVTPDGSFFAEGVDEEQQKVGGNGLALLALVQYARATGDTSDLPLMRELARFVVHQQYPDGHFRDNADVMHDDEAAREKKLKKEVVYYAGEAALGMVRLYALDPDPRWLAAAKKGLDYIVQVRDAHDDLKTQNHDHWQSYALHDLYAITRDKAYLDQANKIAKAILLGEKTPESAPYPDYVGTFYDGGETTPTSTRLEALASTMQLSRLAGVDEKWLEPVAMQLACMMRGEQLDAESVFYAKNPARALGGVREGPLNGDVRIDYAQHAMSAWLRLARLQRDGAYGTGTDRKDGKDAKEAGRK